MTPRDFHTQVAVALSGCQLVEQELKLYISEALELVHKCLQGRLPFSMSGKDYEDASLERLIDTFRKLNNNAELIGRLRKFKDERNFLSHKAVAYCLDRTGAIDLAAVHSIEQRLGAIHPTAERLCVDINEEAYNFRIHLWPD